MKRDLDALLRQYENTPTRELRVKLLEEHFAACCAASTVYQVAKGRDLLASEQRRADRAITAQIRVEVALTAISTTPRLADARARLAAI